MSYESLLFVGIYIILLLLLSAFFVKKALDSYMEYSFCGRSLTIAFVIFTYLGTWIGGGTIVGLVGNSYFSGASQYWMFGISCVMGFFFVFLFMTRIRRMQVTGIADMLAMRFPDYGEVIRIPAAVGLIIRNVTVLGMNFAAMSYMFSFYTGIDQKLATLISLSVVIFYTVSSGLWGVVVTDVLQGFLQTAGMFLLLFFTLKCNGGLENMMTFYQENGAQNLILLPRENVGIGQVIGFVTAFGMFFLMGDQSDWERIYSCKTDRTAFWGYLIPLTITLLLLLMPTYIGVFLKNIVDGVPGSYLLYWFTSKMLPAWTSTIIIIMILSATLSSADSFMVATGIILSGDLIRRFINPKANDMELIFWTRMAVIISGAIGFAFAINTMDIMGLWMAGIGIASIVILPSYLMAWFSRRVNTLGVLSGMGVGGLYSAVVLLTGASFETWGIVGGILLNTICTIIVSLCSVRPDPETVEQTWYWSKRFWKIGNIPRAKERENRPQ